jgi:hypothetical protein
MRAAAVIALVLATRAFADSQSEADAHARRGVALYNLAKYEEAVIEFENAYTLVQSDALLFNLAQSHRQLNHCELALQYYKRFMAGTPSPALAKQVDALLPKLEAACRTKLERPTGPAPEHDPPPAPEPAATPPAPAPGPVPEVPATVDEPKRLSATAAVTGGTVISNKTAPTAGVEIALATPLPWIRGVEIGGVAGAARLWRSDGDRDTQLSHVAATLSIASRQPWARLTLGVAFGGVHISSLDTSSGVVPGVRRSGLWMPLARAEAGAEHDIADAFALRIGLAIGVSPRSGPMLESMTQVGVLVGVRYQR